MKRVFLICLISLSAIIATGQDFSYLKEIDLQAASQVAEAKEAAMECCCYLTGVRYDKKDEQRQVATAYVKNWLEKTCGIQYKLEELFEDESELAGVYLVFYALNYLNHPAKTDVAIIQADALKGLIAYCSNSANKLKLSKELKVVEEMIEAGQLGDSITDLDLSSLTR
ncbi:hypothetical protein [Carboxylicivirga taeanensis]|uniref:hypothetical protein n=1 Tax=Carboxylicivirga taeanensis TaxID=1416875 RepID=UPI003F6E0BAE